MKFNVEEIYSKTESVSEAAQRELREAVINIMENEVLHLGSGATAKVYYLDDNPDLCYKTIRTTEVLVRPDAVDSLPPKYRAIHEDKKEKGKRMLGVPDTDMPWHLSLEEEMRIQNEAAKLSGVKIPQGFGRINVDGVEDGDGYEIKDNLSCLLMERIKGVSITELIGKGLLPPPGFNLDRFEKQITEFLEQMHAAGIYHRDLHDGNVMIEEETGDACIIDFGRATITRFSEEDPYVDEVIDGEKMRFVNDNLFLQKRVIGQLKEYLKYRGLDKSAN